ncbi:hypothetical protein ES705_45185 [subsurface metagenome]
MKNIFNEEYIEKTIFNNRWVRFAFGNNGIIKTKNLNMCITEFSIGDSSPIQKHDVDEAIYVLSGNGSIKIDEETHRIRDGDFIYVPQGSNHSMETDQKNKLKILTVFSGTTKLEY